MKPAGMAVRVVRAVLAGSVMVGVAVLGTVAASAVGTTSSTTALTVSPTGPVMSDQPVIFTATVAATAPGGATPTGDVTFESRRPGVRSVSEAPIHHSGGWHGQLHDRHPLRRGVPGDDRSGIPG